MRVHCMEDFFGVGGISGFLLAVGRFRNILNFEEKKRKLQRL